MQDQPYAPMHPWYLLLVRSFGEIEFPRYCTYAPSPPCAVLLAEPVGRKRCAFPRKNGASPRTRRGRGRSADDRTVLPPRRGRFLGFKGSIELLPEKAKGVSYQVMGNIEQVDATTLRITELPIRKWTQVGTSPSPRRQIRLARRQIRPLSARIYIPVVLGC
eukprot:541684-Prorocentrum_minimum.AAC.3